MSMLAFSCLTERAKAKLEKAKSIMMPTTISTSCSLIVFASEHIHLLEEQLGAQQNLTRDWKDEAKKTQRQIEAILDAVPNSSNFSRQDLINIINKVR